MSNRIQKSASASSPPAISSRIHYPIKRAAAPGSPHLVKTSPTRRRRKLRAFRNSARNGKGKTGSTAGLRSSTGRRWHPPLLPFETGIDKLQTSASASSSSSSAALCSTSDFPSSPPSSSPPQISRQQSPPPPQQQQQGSRHGSSRKRNLYQAQNLAKSLLFHNTDLLDSTEKGDNTFPRGPTASEQHRSGSEPQGLKSWKKKKLSHAALKSEAEGHLKEEDSQGRPADSSIITSTAAPVVEDDLARPGGSSGGGVGSGSASSSPSTSSTLASSTASVPVARPSTLRQHLSSGAANTIRSSSPAKRTRAEMEVTNDGDGDTEDVTMTAAKNGVGAPVSSPLASGMVMADEAAGVGSSEAAAGEPPANKKMTTRLTQDARATRELSVDMTSEDSGVSSSLSHNVFRTPQSGTSSSSSVANTALSSNTPATSSASNGSSATVSGEKIPPLDEQIAVITMMSQKPIYDGMKGFLILNKWLEDAQDRGTNAHRSSKETRGDVQPPVDNRELIDPRVPELIDENGDKFYQLRPGLAIANEIEIIPQEAWEQIVRWHGVVKESPDIIRYCHNTSDSASLEHLQFELYPPTFTILKLPNISGGLTPKVLAERQLPPVKLVSSRHQLYQSFLKRAKAAAQIQPETHVRIWRILGNLSDPARQQVGILTPAQSRSASPAPAAFEPIDLGDKLILDMSIFVGLQEGSQRELIDMKDETNNPNYNGRSNLGLVGLGQEGVIVLEERVMGPGGGEWVSETARSSAYKNGLPVKSLLSSGSLAATASGALKAKSAGSGRTSPAPTGANGPGMMTRGRAQLQRIGRTRGTIGLGNLGNTCYMNSALQCVRSVEELTCYFLEGKYADELNPRNPLGYKGEVASAYASLLKEMYSSHAVSSFSPRQFKQVIGRHRPSFSGYGQQDSQELLLFLLDGLHEDLNRIHDKPYMEYPDSTDEMVRDQRALTELADKCWDIYKQRNDSVITDLFAGMYKSTVVCPVCDKVSIIFDPFNNLTLQLPVENLWSRQVKVFPLLRRGVLLSVEIDKNSTFWQLKEYVGKKCGIQPKKLVCSEIYKHRFFKMFDDKHALTDERIADNDDLAFYEVDQIPSNYPAPKKTGQKVRSLLHYNQSDEDEDVPEEDTPLSDRMLVPVFNRIPKDPNSRINNKTLFGLPFYIVLTREEAADQDEILRKVLMKVSTLTTRDIVHPDISDDSDNSITSEEDMVVLNSKDTDSSSESKIKADSIESEEGMVDVQMPDRNAGTASNATTSSTVMEESGPRFTYPPHLRRPVRTIPHVLRPGAPIFPELKNLFEIGIHHTSDIIPTGWTTLNDESKRLPTLVSRAAERENRLGQKERGPGATLNRRIANGGSASSSDIEIDEPPILRLHTTNSSEDELADHGQGLQDAEDSHHATTGVLESKNSKGLSFPLVRLGEALVLDWSLESYDALFGRERPITSLLDDTSADEDENVNAGEEPVRGMNTWDSLPIMPDEELDRKRAIRAKRRRNGVSLDDCLDEFGKEEILAEEDAWYCPRCKEHRRASKKFELWKAPDVLVVHLKRFSAQGRFRDKLDLLVDFPIEGLDLNSRVVVRDESRDLVYDLFAVDNHYGGLGGGHYTAFAKNFCDGNWYEYNDSLVQRKNNPENVITAAAYLLFYRRRSTSTLGGKFFENLVHSVDQADAPDSQAESPDQASQPATQAAGEGRRLGDSSRNGSSSASHAAGAIHQAGGGGLAAAATGAGVVAAGSGAATAMSGVTGADTRMESDEEPPVYSEHDPRGEQLHQSMEMDYDDDKVGGVRGARGGGGGGFQIMDLQQPTWSFKQYSATAGEEPEEPEDEGIDTSADADAQQLSSSTFNHMLSQKSGGGISTLRGQHSQRAGSVSSTGAAASGSEADPNDVLPQNRIGVDRRHQQQHDVFHTWDVDDEILDDDDDDVRGNPGTPDAEVLGSGADRPPGSGTVEDAAMLFDDMEPADTVVDDDDDIEVQRLTTAAPAPRSGGVFSTMRYMDEDDEKVAEIKLSETEDDETKMD